MVTMVAVAVDIEEPRAEMSPPSSDNVSPTPILEEGPSCTCSRVVSCQKQAGEPGAEALKSSSKEQEKYCPPSPPMSV